MQDELRKEASKVIHQALSPNYHSDEIHALKFWLIDALLEIPQTLWFDNMEQWKALLDNHTPIQYIFNRAFFGNLELYVDPNTLIPRPETEELCELLLNHSQNSKHSSHQVIDIGTGSGCIPLWLKHNRPHWNITGLDVSKNALEIARKNAFSNNLEVEFIEEDFLKIESIPEQYSILISNPPYIKKNQFSKLNKNVINFEPHLALFVENNDPLIFYKKIAKLLEKNHSIKQVWLEIDTESAAENVLIFKKLGAAEIIIDYSGNPRFIFLNR